ncbi:MAG: 2-oxoacid:acceptor oxidoreductase family protein [Peptococcaceae bacterium]|nr:2-oxoacid:acceptor oxidoreductase family protein [Peptococcaceae bacterium]
MLQFKIQGRGGQGAQKAAEILAEAFFREGKYIQAYATYGGARRGTPVSSFVRVDDKPIRLRCDIENPDVIVCFDPSLLTGALLQGAGEDTLLLINSASAPDHFASLGNFRISTVDAVTIAHANDLGRIVNTTLVGAFAGLVNKPDLDILIRVIREKSPAKVDQNVKAFLEGYRAVTGGMN